MKGQELIKKIKRLAKEKDIYFEIKSQRGKGSHSTLFFGENFTIIPDIKRELKTGTCKAILKQLGIKESELR